MSKRILDLVEDCKGNLAGKWRVVVKRDNGTLTQNSPWGPRIDYVTTKYPIEVAKHKLHWKMNILFLL